MQQSVSWLFNWILQYCNEILKVAFILDSNQQM